MSEDGSQVDAMEADQAGAAETPEASTAKRPVAEGNGASSAPPPTYDPIYILIRCMGRRSISFRRGQTLTIGRQSDNDIIFNDGTVSRHHAELRWDKDEDRPSVIDLGSANGIEVDGEPVEGRAWLSGDNQVDIGDFTLVLQLKGVSARIKRRTTSALLRSESGPISRTVVKLFSEKGKGFKGSIDSAADLQKVMLDIEQDERTGTLEVRVGKAAYRTTFSQGLIVTCYKGDQSGEDILDEMADTVRGSYHFTTDIEPSEECLNLSPAAFYRQRG